MCNLSTYISVIEIRCCASHYLQFGIKKGIFIYSKGGSQMVIKYCIRKICDFTRKNLICNAYLLKCKTWIWKKFIRFFYEKTAGHLAYRNGMLNMVALQWGSKLYRRIL